MIDRVARLLDEGAQVDARDDIGFTALHRAAMGGHADIARLLLKRGIPVDAKRARQYRAPLRRHA